MPQPHHDHAHGHAHDHFARGGTEKRLLGALLLTGGFMVAEVIGGIVSGSLALLADAGHMLTDVGALALAYVGVRLARRAGDPQRTFGYARLEVLAAFTNGIALLALSAWILVEVAIRFFEPVQVLSGTMLAVALIGLAVNVASFFVLRGGEEANVNIQGALVHVLGDLLGSMAAIVAAIVIRFTGWMPIDPLCPPSSPFSLSARDWTSLAAPGTSCSRARPKQSVASKSSAAWRRCPALRACTTFMSDPSHRADHSRHCTCASI